MLHLDDHGNPAAIIEINNDITERKLAEEALRNKNDDLTHMNRAMVGRELRMLEMKKEINELCEQTGRAPRYTLDAGKQQV